MNTQFLAHEGGKIAYDIIGNGPLVVCAPGMGDLRQEYRFLASHLATEGYQVVSMDVRGHGETSTDWKDYSKAAIGGDMLALIRSLDAGPAVVVGTSYAAGAAVWAAAEAPGDVAGVILAGPFVRDGGSRMIQLLFAALFARPWGPATWLRYYKSLYPTRKPDDFPQYAAALRANLAGPGRIESLQKMMKASNLGLEARLAKVSQPALVLMGDKDPDFNDPAAEARWIADSLRGTYHMIPGAGHYPHAEMPEITAPLVQSFLEKVYLPMLVKNAA
jgi:pimeloyl-ACP methyl ester carboxylesterase